jgi:hypothetical protein
VETNVDVGVSSEEESDEVKEERTTESAAVAQSLRQMDERERVKLAKVMAKMAAPEKFSGETVKQKEGVEQWVEHITAYVDGQFSQLGESATSPLYDGQRVQFIKSYLSGAALDWLSSAYSIDLDQTWNDLKPQFITFIKGGRESREVWRQQLHSLKYGTGNCKDLLGLEQEFERLRIKLYPTSSEEGPMNQRVADDYGQCIRRGDVDLYTKALMILTMTVNANEEPTLRDWKLAAGKAVHLREVERTAQRGGAAAGGAPTWKRPHNPSAAVNEVNTEAGEDSATAGGGPLGQQSTSAINRVDSKPARKRLLTDAQDKEVKERKLCWQCYKPGHRKGDDACTEKDQARRKPKAGELNA